MVARLALGCTCADNGHGAPSSSDVCPKNMNVTLCMSTEELWYVGWKHHLAIDFPLGGASKKYNSQTRSHIGRIFVVKHQITNVCFADYQPGLADEYAAGCRLLALAARASGASLSHLGKRDETEDKMDADADAGADADADVDADAGVGCPIPSGSRTRMTPKKGRTQSQPPAQTRAGPAPLKTPAQASGSGLGSGSGPGSGSGSGSVPGSRFGHVQCELMNAFVASNNHGLESLARGAHGVLNTYNGAIEESKAVLVEFNSIIGDMTGAVQDLTDLMHGLNTSNRARLGQTLGIAGRPSVLQPPLQLEATGRTAEQRLANRNNVGRELAARMGQ